MPDYSTEEKQVLRLANEFREMMENKWWQEYSKILEAQILDRQKLLLLPLSEQHPKFSNMDFTTRAVSLETIKGAIIGLRLALDLPRMTIAHASDIVREHEEDVDAA